MAAPKILVEKKEGKVMETSYEISFVSFIKVKTGF